MGQSKACSVPQAFLVSESKRIFQAVAKCHGGEKMKAQIRSVSIDLGIEFDVARRARYGRIGGRAFPGLCDAFVKWNEVQRERGMIELRELHDRIVSLERGKSNAHEASDMDGASASRCSPLSSRAKVRAA
jgi:hypothetical protein